LVRKKLKAGRGDGGRDNDPKKSCPLSEGKVKRKNPQMKVDQMKKKEKKDL